MRRFGARATWNKISTFPTTWQGLQQPFTHQGEIGRKRAADLLGPVALIRPRHRVTAPHNFDFSQ
jgi:hypothetical protein